MLFLYVVNEAVYYVSETAETRFHNFDEDPTIIPELSFQFPTLTHPLNTLLADFFKNMSGFFHYDRYYDVSLMYTKNPSEVITRRRFKALDDLEARAIAFGDVEDVLENSE